MRARSMRPSASHSSRASSNSSIAPSSSPASWRAQPMLFASDPTQRRARGSAELRASAIARSFHDRASSGGSTMPSMCAASTASASSPTAPASSHAARNGSRPRPGSPDELARRPRSSRSRSRPRSHRQDEVLAPPRRASPPRRRSAAGGPARGRAASGSLLRTLRLARSAPVGGARRTELRSRPDRRSPRAGRARRAGWMRLPTPRSAEARHRGERPARGFVRGQRPERVRCREDLDVEGAVPARGTEGGDERCGIAVALAR